jgi:hypothetical protein
MTNQLARASAIKAGDMLSPDGKCAKGTVLVLEVKPVLMGRRASSGRGFEILMFEVATQHKFSVRYADSQTTSWYHHVGD